MPLPGGVRDQTEAAHCKWRWQCGGGTAGHHFLSAGHAMGRVVCRHEPVVMTAPACQACFLLHVCLVTLCGSLLARPACQARLGPAGRQCTPHPLAQGASAHAHHAAQRQNKPAVGTTVGPGWWGPASAQMQWAPTRVPCRGWQPGVQAGAICDRGAALRLAPAHKLHQPEYAGSDGRTTGAR